MQKIFECKAEDENYNNDLEKRIELQKTKDEGFLLFVKYYEHLWN